eukprot:gene12112-5604_t
MTEELLVDLKAKKFTLVSSEDKKPLSTIDYVVKNNVFILEHTNTPPELQGNGFAGKISKKVFDYLEENKIKFYPQCSYLVNYCKKHDIKFDEMDSKL